MSSSDVLGDGQHSLEVTDGAWHEGGFADFCAKNVPQLSLAAGRFTVRKFAVGQSNPTFLVATPLSKAVVRMKPIGARIPGAHAVEREFRVLRALHSVGFPVPKPFALCEDDTVLGAAFYVMEFVEGRIFVDPSLPSLSPQDRVAVVRSAMATLRQLHSYKPAEVGLDTYGKHDGYYKRQISTLSRISQKQVSDVLVVMERPRCSEGPRARTRRLRDAVGPNCE